MNLSAQQPQANPVQPVDPFEEAFGKPAAQEDPDCGPSQPQYQAPQANPNWQPKNKDKWNDCNGLFDLNNLKLGDKPLASKDEAPKTATTTVPNPMQKFIPVGGMPMMHPGMPMMQQPGMNPAGMINPQMMGMPMQQQQFNPMMMNQQMG